MKRKDPKLTRKQKALADYILANPTATAKEAAKQAYNLSSDRTAEVIGSRELRKAEMMAYMENHAQTASDTVLTVIKHSKQKMIEDEKNGSSWATVALNGSKDVLDRVYGKATQRVETSSKVVQINIDMTSPDGI